MEVSSNSAGKLPSSPPKECRPSSSSSFQADPNQEADSFGFKQADGESSCVHDVPNQNFDSEMGQEFNGGTPTLIELFCGTAGVSAQFKLAGGKSMGIDHQVKRHKLKAAAVQMDLKQPWVQELLFKEVASGRVDAIHMAPPCGTSSAARNIPIKRKLRQKGAPQPRPLRSHQFPDGLPSLKGLNRAKVQSANQLYDFCARLCRACEKHGVLFVVENPENSMMWSTSFFSALVDKFYFSVADNCEYGSEYKKATGFLSNFLPQRLQTRCSGEHVHKKWTIDKDADGVWQFSTSKEAEYPTMLAKAIALSFIDRLAELKPLHLVDDLVDHAAKLSTYTQPRRARGPLLLSEFKTKVQLSCNPDSEVPKFIPEDAEFPWQGIPIGSKLLETQPISDSNGVVVRLVATFGVYYTEHEFLQNALRLEHPFDTPLPLEESNMQSISFICDQGPAATAKFRAEQLRYYVGRAKALESDEKQLHLRLHESLRPVLKKKRLLLFKEMLKDAQVDDPHLFDEVCNGFRLIGDLNASGQFQPQWKPAGLSTQQLRQTAVWAQQAVVGSCKRVLEDKEIAQSVWDETVSQASEDRKWVLGPFSASEISNRVGDCWIPARRFGVRQGGKIRPVDDFSQFLINSTVTCHEKIDLEGIDHICATARHFLGAWDRDNGRQCWLSESDHQLLGRCLDLKQAYKQLVRHPEDRWVSVLAVVCPTDGEVYFFEAVALPFGAISSVLAFNRVARSMRTILSRLFKLVVTNFFDDFCQLEVDQLQSSAWKTAEMVMELLGWDISMGDDKRRPFEKSFEILGAVVSFESSPCRCIRVSNKESRIVQIQDMYRELEKSMKSSISRSFLESLKGRLLYAAGHTYGRCTQLACQLLHRVANVGAKVDVTPELVHCVCMAVESLAEARPREIFPWKHEKPILVFTDGAVENDYKDVSFGAVMVDASSGKSFVFGAAISEHLVNKWQSDGRRQVISQAELYPILVAKETWCNHLASRSILWFTDNESARMALVRSFSPVVDNFSLLQVNAKLDMELQSRHWYSRVPSKSNIADAASRLCFDSYSDFTMFLPVHEFCDSTLEHLESLKGELLEKGR